MKLRYYIMVFIVGIFMNFSLAQGKQWMENEPVYDQMRQVTLYSAMTTMDDGNVGDNDLGIVMISCEMPRKTGNLVFGALNKNTLELDRVLGILDVFANDDESLTDPMSLNAYDTGIQIPGIVFYTLPVGAKTEHLGDGLRAYAIDELLVSLSKLKNFGFSMKTLRATKDIYFLNFNGIEETRVWKNCVE